MDELLIFGVFLAGAGSGALLKYMQDQRLLSLYGDLVRQLSTALKQQVDAAEKDAAEQARLTRQRADKLREKAAS